MAVSEQREQQEPKRCVWGPRPPTNTLSSGSGDLTEEQVGRHLRSGLTHGRLDAMDRDYPPVEELPLDPQDTLSIMAERDLLMERVAELEDDVAYLDAQNKRLRGYYMRDRVAHSAIADYVSVIGEAGWWRARAAAWKRAAKRKRDALIESDWARKRAREEAGRHQSNSKGDDADGRLIPD